MVVVRGKKSGSASGPRQLRTALALVLTFGAVQACGSRTMLTADEGEESGASGSDNGGSSSSGTAGRGGTGTGANGGGGVGGGSLGGTYGKGGTTAKGGTTGKGGSYGYGGSGAFGGSYGGSGAYGGTYGKGGTNGKGGAAGYPMMTGGAYTYGGGGGSYPTAGYGGRGGRVGRGGRGGTSNYGGTGGIAGTGAMGYGGSPTVVNACYYACPNLPASCPEGGDPGSCIDSCLPLATEYPQCSLELADWINCLGANLSPNAQCMVGSDGACYGQGCTTSAQEACQYWSDTFENCANSGCGTGYGVGQGYCSYDQSCPNHDHQTECKVADPSTDTWFCTCTIDYSYAFETYISGYSTSSCTQVAQACAVAR